MSESKRFFEGSHDWFFLVERETCGRGIRLDDGELCLDANVDERFQLVPSYHEIDFHFLLSCWLVNCDFHKSVAVLCRFPNPLPFPLPFTAQNSLK